MIDKIRKGKRVRGLVYYLYGPGKANEHRDPHIVAGWRDPPAIEPPFRPDGNRDFRGLVDLLEAPLDAVNRLGAKDTVWQCVLSAAPEDPLLSDEQWNEIAADFMDRMGLAPKNDPAGVRWIAIRHGLSKDGRDHIHIVATVARQDGRRPNMHNDYLRARKAAREIEKDFGLRITSPADCTAVPRPGRAETEHAKRIGLSEPPRVTLRNIVQDAAATALSEDDFLARIRESGALIRIRNSTEQPGKATGYAVALPAERSKTGREIWFGGGKLAPDLTLPKLRKRWEHNPAGRVGTGAATAPDNTGKMSLDPRSVRAFLRSATRNAAERARNEAGFFRLLDDAGILVKCRYSELDPGQVTGYALTLPGHADENGDLAWYSGGRLSENLTLPKLRKRWDSPTPVRMAPAALSDSERHAIWADVTRLTGDGAAELRRLATADPAAAADTAWATADALRASAQALGGREGQYIRRAAGHFDRAARSTYRTIPRPTPAGNGLRTASRLLAVLGRGDGRGVRIEQLIISLIQLAEETARLRLAQMQSHQAEAARRAAEQLGVLRRDQARRPKTSDRRTRPAPNTGNAARVARMDVPAIIRLQPPVPDQRQGSQPARSPVAPATRRAKPEGPAP